MDFAKERINLDSLVVDALGKSVEDRPSISIHADHMVSG